MPSLIDPPGGCIFAPRCAADLIAASPVRPSSSVSAAIAPHVGCRNCGGSLAPVAQVLDLEIRFGGGVQALAGVTLQIPAQTTIGLVGESGSGKTTLAKALVGLRRPTGGLVRLAGRDVYALARGERAWLSRQVQMIFQDPVSSLSPRFTIRELLAEPLKIHRLPIAEHWPRISDMLEVLGIRKSLLDRYPHQIE